jgi:hypothetical protein
VVASHRVQGYRRNAVQAVTSCGIRLCPAS